MLERAFGRAFRSFWTLFLVALVVTLPLQFGWAFAFKNEIAVADLAPDIARFPAHRQVLSVGRDQLTEARVAYWAVTGIELLLLPLVAAAARRALEADAAGYLPTVADAYAHALDRDNLWRGPASEPGPLVVAAVVTVAVGMLLRAVGLLVVDPLSPATAFAGVGTVEGVARALAAPFFLSVWVGDIILPETGNSQGDAEPT